MESRKFNLLGISLVPSWETVHHERSIAAFDIAYLGVLPGAHCILIHSSMSIMS